MPNVGTKLSILNGKLSVPNRPILGFIEGDGCNSSINCLDFVEIRDDGSAGDGGHNVLFVAANAGARFTLRNSTVEIDAEGGSADGRVSFFGSNSLVENCTFRRNDFNGNPNVMVGDLAGGTIFRNSALGPKNDGSPIALTFDGDNAEQSSSTVTFESCTVTGFPAGQRAMFNGDARRDVIMRDCTIDGRLSFEGDARSIGGTLTLERCTVGGGDGEAIFAGDNSGKVFNFTNCILLGGNNDQFAFSGSNGGPNRGNHTWNLTHCTVTPSADFPRGNFRFLFLEGDNSTNLVQAATEVTLNNNIFANSGSGIAAVFDNEATEAPVVTAGTNLWDGNVAAQDAGVGAGGTDLTGSAALDATGRLTVDSGVAERPYQRPLTDKYTVPQVAHLYR